MHCFDFIRSFQARILMLQYTFICELDHTIAKWISKRLKEHRSALKNAYPQNSTVPEHAMDTGHSIDWTNVNIVANAVQFHHKVDLLMWRMHKLHHGTNQEEGVLLSAHCTLIAND